MEEFIQEFKAEAAGIIQRLQEQVLLLDQDRDNKLIIEEIFRSVHTLKGSARMFGFEKIERITHDLENTYDQIRAGEAKPTSTVIELSLEVADMCSAILKDTFDPQQFDNLMQKLGAEDILTQVVEEIEETIFQILYFPKENIYERGVNPMAALDELKELGATHIFPLRQAPTIEQQALSKKFESVFECLFLYNGKREIIEDVFLF